MTTTLPARSPAPVAPLPPQGCAHILTFSMPIDSSCTGSGPSRGKAQIRPKGSELRPSRQLDAARLSDVARASHPSGFALSLLEPAASSTVRQNTRQAAGLTVGSCFRRSGNAPVPVERVADHPSSAAEARAREDGVHRCPTVFEVRSGTVTVRYCTQPMLCRAMIATRAHREGE